MKEETINEIRELRKDKTILEISKLVEIPISTVRYWIDDEERRKIISKSKDYFNNLSKEKKSEIYKSRSKYISRWICKKYAADPVFKKSLNEKRKKYKKVKE
jgi:hypothetical protein